MINTLSNPIITTTEDEARCWFLVAQLEEMIADVEKGHAEIRAEHEEIRADIEIEKKYAEDDLKFFQNLNSQMGACLTY